MIGVGATATSRSRLTERDAWIALSRVPAIGPATFARLLRQHGSALEAWRHGPPPVGSAGHTPVAARDWPDDPRAVARATDERMRTHGGRVVIATDEAYPPALLTLDPRPPTLYVVGKTAAFETLAVAIVGTRRASGYGLSVTTELAGELARSGVVVVSGLALGIDGAAHRASVATGGLGVAVLPSPVDRVYPPRHRSLARDVVRTGGALVTELPPGSTVGRPDFARRNRLIAGLAVAVVVVEAPDRSGALLTAAAASAIGRELYAVPGPIDAMGSRGCNRLIADKQADVVTSVPALLQRIGLSRNVAPPVVSALSEVEGQVLRRLLDRSGSLEELVDRTSQPPAAVASALTLLEARGLVSSFGGATFHPTLAARRLSGVV